MAVLFRSGCCLVIGVNFLQKVFVTRPFLKIGKIDDIVWLGEDLCRMCPPQRYVIEFSYDDSVNIGLFLQLFFIVLIDRLFS